MSRLGDGWMSTPGTVSISSFVRLSRPHFLLGGALMFALGSAVAPSIDFRRYLLGQAMVTAAQITAHYVNEYADLDADRVVSRRTPFSGGSGVLVEGDLAPLVAIRAAWVSSVATVVLAALTARATPMAAILGVVALSVSWAYSMPPIRLLSSGFGELATSLVVAGLVPLIGVLIQGAPPTAGLWWAIGLLIPVHGAMMLMFELPDLDSDARSGKTVLAVRIGRRPTTRLAAGLMVASGLGLAAALAMGWLPGRAAGAFAAAVPALVTARGIARDRDTVATGGAVATFGLVAVGFLIGFV